ncbi:MAG: ATP-binding protein [Eubacterium sp.]|nr:ATP-binding protein [Eubacterium sp.]
MNQNNRAKIFEAFEAKRARHEYEQSLRKKQIYTRIPELAHIDAEINRLGIDLTKKRLRGEANALEAFKEATAALETQRDALLAAQGFSREDLAIRHDCPLCQDTGYVEGKMCSCLSQALTDSAFTSFDLKPLAKSENFGSFNLDFYSEIPLEGKGVSPRKNSLALKQLLMDYCDAFDTVQENYLFYGPPGVGKTFMSNCVANALIEKKYSVVYTSAAHLIRLVQSSMFERDGDLDHIHQTLTACDLLIIDDLGAEYVTAFSGKQLFEIINTRLLGQKKMIISSNLTATQIMEQYDERLSSRIRGNFTALPFIGQDIRLLKKAARRK